MSLRVVFFGTPEFAVPTLARLVASPHRVVAAVTQPDRPRGRGQHVTASPVKTFASSHGVPVWQPSTLKDEAFIRELAGAVPDLGIVAAYGKILSQSLLDTPRLGFLNVHASLLPRWRGAAPVHRAIIAGDRETGVTIMRMVRALDAGPMLARAAVPITDDDTSADVEPRLAEMGADMLLAALERAERDPSFRGDPQDERLVTYAARLERADGAVDWSRPAIDLHNQIRGLQPWPLAAVWLNGRRMMLLRSAVVPDARGTAAPGTIVHVDASGLSIATGRGELLLTRVQLEGRPPVSVADFLNGHRAVPGDRLASHAPHP
jgi:methionyl-tRNA formyltransferase